MSITFKRVLLMGFLIVVLFICPIVATITATRMFEEAHIKEIRQYDEWKVHELYQDKWNYCPNCGIRLSESGVRNED